jgi:hypothetical protein
MNLHFGRKIFGHVFIWVKTVDKYLPDSNGLSFQITTTKIQKNEYLLTCNWPFFKIPSVNSGRNGFIKSTPGELQKQGATSNGAPMKYSTRADNSPIFY